MAHVNRLTFWSPDGDGIVDVPGGPFTVAVDGMARPHRLLVELDALALRAPEDHRPEPPVADGQRFRPLGRRLLVPEHVPVRRLVRRSGHKHEQKKASSIVIVAPSVMRMEA